MASLRAHSLAVCFLWMAVLVRATVIRGKLGVSAPLGTTDGRVCNFGELGQFDPASIPRGRFLMTGDATADGKGIWIHGGRLNCAGDSQDLWQYSPSLNLWAWMGGCDSNSSPYGTAWDPNTCSKTDCLPHIYEYDILWVDPLNPDRVWIYGGIYQYGPSYFSDLWSFHNDTGFCFRGNFNSNPSYVAPGVEDPSNSPGSVSQGVHFANPVTGELFLYYNDIWKLRVDTVNEQYLWTLAETTDNHACFSSPTPTYGPKGVFGAAYCPGHRQGFTIEFAMWADRSDSQLAFLYGGWNDAETAFFADLWAFNMTSYEWAFLGGYDDSTATAASIFGFPGDYHEPLWPSFRRGNNIGFRSMMKDYHVLWGGLGAANSSVASYGSLNQVWMLDTRVLSDVKWTLVGGNPDLINYIGDPLIFGLPADYTITPAAQNHAFTVWNDDSFWSLMGIDMLGSINNAVRMYLPLVLVFEGVTPSVHSSAILPAFNVSLTLFGETRYTIAENYVVTLSVSAPVDYSGVITGTLTKPIVDGYATFDDIAFTQASAGVVIQAATIKRNNPIVFNSPPITVECTIGCKVCTGNGLAWGGSNPCQVCDESIGFYVNEPFDACTNLCGLGHFTEILGAFKHCRSCTTGCASCTNTGLSTVTTCHACDVANGWVEGTNKVCSQTCQPGEYKDLTVGKCITCLPGCHTCTDGTAFCECDGSLQYAQLPDGSCNLNCPYGMEKVAVGAGYSCSPASCDGSFDENILVKGCTDYSVGAVCELSCEAGSIGKGADIACQQLQLNAPATWSSGIACLTCKSNTYAPYGSLECLPCENGFTNSSGTPDVSGCLCLPGYYETNPNDGDCVLCPSGGQCDGRKSRPVAAPGYFQPGTAAAFVPCDPAEACLGSNVCADNYMGYVCGICSPGSYRLVGICKTCPDDSAWRIVLVVIICVLLAIGSLHLMKPNVVTDRTYGFVSLTIAVSFVQVVSTFGDLHVDWPEFTRSALNALSSLNFNIEIVSPECVIALGFWDKFWFSMLFPFMVLGVFLTALGCILLFLFCYERFPSYGDFRPKLVLYVEMTASAYNFFLTLCYLFLSRACISMFSCTQQGNYIVLTDSPGDSCYDEKWHKYLPLGIFGVIFYVVGIPLITPIVFSRLRAKYGKEVAGRSTLARFQVQKYRPECWYWEIFIAWRKLLVVLVAAFLRTSAATQIACCCIIFFGACVITLFVKPYDWSRHNLIECFSLVASFLLLFCGQFASTNDFNESQRAILDGAALTVVAISGIAFIACLVFEVRMYVHVSTLYYRLRPNTKTVKPIGAHPLTSVLFTDLKSIVTADVAGTVNVWDPAVLESRKTFALGSDTTALVSRGEELIVARGAKVEVWNLTTGTKLRSWNSKGDVACLACDSQWVVGGTKQGQLAIWTHAATVAPIVSPVTLTPTNPDEDISGLDAMLGNTNPIPFEVISPRSDYCNAHTATETAGVTALRLHARVAYTGGPDGCVVKWNVAAASSLRQWSVNGGAAVGTHVITALDESGDRILAGTANGAVFIIDVYSGAIRSIKQHQAAVTSLWVLSDSFVSASADGSIFVCNQAKGEYGQEVPHSGTPINAMTVIANPPMLFAGDVTGHMLRYPIQLEWNVQETRPKAKKFARRCCGMRRKYAVVPDKPNVEQDQDRGALGDVAMDAFTTEPQSRRSPRTDAAAGVGAPNDSAITSESVYHELDIVAEALNLPAFPWRQVNPENASSIAVTLAIESKNLAARASTLRVPTPSSNPNASGGLRGGSDRPDASSIAGYEEQSRDDYEVEPAMEC